MNLKPINISENRNIKKLKNVKPTGKTIGTIAGFGIGSVVSILCSKDAFTRTVKDVEKGCDKTIIGLCAASMVFLTAASTAIGHFIGSKADRNAEQNQIKK